MQIYVSVEDNKVKDYLIGTSSSPIDIPIPQEYTLADLRFLIITDQVTVHESPRMEFDPETNEMIPVLDDEGNPIMDSYETTQKEITLDQEAKDQYEADQAAVQIQSERNNKLKKLRELRDAKLKDVDVMVNELALDLRSDKEAIIVYRQALMDFTDPYRYANDPNKAKVAIDSLDLNNIVWPEAP
jgi:hypothetical protein